MTDLDPEQRGPFSAEIRRLRRDRLESQVQLSLHTGIAQAAISRLETGERLPTEDQMSRLAAHFEVAIDELRRRANLQRAHGQRTEWPWDTGEATGLASRSQTESRWVYEGRSSSKRQDRLDELEVLGADTYAAIGRLVSHATNSPDPVVRDRAGAILAQVKKLARLRR